MTELSEKGTVFSPFTKGGLVKKTILTVRHPFSIYLSDHHQLKIDDIAFRRNRRTGNPLAGAGNIFKWRGLGQLFSDKTCTELIGNALQGMKKMANERSVAFSIELPEMIGWEFSLDIEKAYAFPRRRVEIAKGVIDMLIGESLVLEPAPMTNSLSFFGAVSGGIGSQPQLRVFAIYPGACLGLLEGDVGTRTGRCIYPRKHRGELPSR